MTTGELLFVIVVAAIGLYVYRTLSWQRRWPKFYVAQDWDGQDANALYDELRQQGVRADMDLGAANAFAHGTLFRPPHRTIRVFHTDVTRAQAILTTWPNRHRQDAQVKRESAPDE